jgi:tetratricopeptide (TPR) repeat protein
MGWMYIGRGEPARALAELEPVGERFRELFGERSQDYGNNLYNRALAYRALGQMDRAYDSFRAAAEAYAASAASGASQIGWALWNASRILTERGEHKAARRLLDEIEDNWRDSIAEDARVRGPFYSSVTENRLVLGDLAEAERYADRAHSLLVRLDGESADVAIVLALTAKVANARNDVPRAPRPLPRSAGDDRTRRAGTQRSARCLAARNGPAFGRTRGDLTPIMRAPRCHPCRTRPAPRGTP